MVQVGIKTMAKNEKAQFMINHNYGYGRFGCPPRIPEQATILGLFSCFGFDKLCLSLQQRWRW